MLDFEPEEEEVLKTDDGIKEAEEKVKEGDDGVTGGGKPDWLNNVASPTRFDWFSHDFTRNGHIHVAKHPAFRHQQLLVCPTLTFSHQVAREGRCR